MLTLYFESGSMTAGAIAKMFKHAWPTTTRHLQILESAELLHHERQGREPACTESIVAVLNWCVTGSAWFS